MVLRSGIILPFQFRDCKKLLMIGVPEENRDLSIWDLKNVVRAAFGIYNFEFRNKKIGFNIPDELLLQYLAQRHDLTNFVIEIGQGNDDMCMNLKEQLTYEPSCSQKLSIPLPQKSNESLTCDTAIMAATQMGQLYGNSPSSAMGVLTASMPLVTRNRSPPPPDCMENHSDHSSNLEPAHRMRSMCKPYNDNTPESLTQSMDPMDIIPKSEQDENELTDNREMHYERHNNQQEIQHQMPQEAQSIHQQQLQAITQSQQSSQQQFIANYGHHQANLLSNTINNVTPSSPHIPPPPITPQLTHMSNQPAQTQYSPNMMNRFRRRGERMSKDQKELYVKFFEENPCMLTQRRNDIILEPLWNKLGSLLNSVPQGAVKNVEEWKQTFDAWRYRVFMYTRYNTKLAGAVAQNPKNYKPLTTTDQRAYAMWTSHKSVATQEFEKIEMFQNLDETQTDYDY